ncbi:MAG: formylglycine-generating enzyme family protein [Kiritimatiellae bacterium]|nr:formylglycine-generating enzyme family protein [Kiritimatiellia bacterium]
MNFNRSASIVCGLTALALRAAVPEVSDVTMAQDVATRTVTITYRLANAPAVVTVDIQTNATGSTWASIGGENISCFDPGSEVWKKVSGDAEAVHTITWHPDHSWPDHKVPAGEARAVVTAWSLDNPPDYMVVNVGNDAVADSAQYYPAENYLPGGLLTNPDYRQSLLVLRKISAKNVTFTMGSVNEATPWNDARETTHQATITNNYYIGVFPVTQLQWQYVTGYNFSKFKTGGAMRPAEWIGRSEIRSVDGSTRPTAEYLESNPDYDWPNAPYPNSFLGKLRTKTGFSFDLPTEAQWEYACRAGRGEGYWNDGSLIATVAGVDNNLPGRYAYNGGFVDGGSGMVEPSYIVGPTNGTAQVGSYAPNAWGLYDMHGNVWEFCLDFYETDITGLDGRLNVNPNDSRKTYNGGTSTLGTVRGGSWSPRYSKWDVSLPYSALSARSASRTGKDLWTRYDYAGFRLVLTDGLK